MRKYLGMVACALLVSVAVLEVGGIQTAMVILCIGIGVMLYGLWWMPIPRIPSQPFMEITLEIPQDYIWVMIFWFILLSVSLFW